MRENVCDTVRGSGMHGHLKPSKIRACIAPIVAMIASVIGGCSGNDLAPSSEDLPCVTAFQIVVKVLENDAKPATEAEAQKAAVALMRSMCVVDIVRLLTTYPPGTVPDAQKIAKEIHALDEAGQHNALIILSYIENTGAVDPIETALRKEISETYPRIQSIIAWIPEKSETEHDRSEHKVRAKSVMAEYRRSLER